MISKVIFVLIVPSVCFLSCLLLVECTIDMTHSDFFYIADHLSKTECRRLVASLHVLDYALPDLSDALKEVPKKESCIHLLIDWNSEDSKTGGRGRSHVDVAHRLRQLGKRKLADWLGNAAFYHLAIDMDETLNSYPFKVNENIESPVVKNSKNKETSAEGWTTYDTILWSGIVAGTGFAFYQIVDRSCANNRKQKDDQCVLEDLLIRENFDSDDDYASENIFYNSIEHFDED